MNVHISYKIQKTPDIEKELNQHIGKLERRLQVFRPELVHLHGIIDEASAREGFTVSLNLRLPSGQMAAKGVAAGPDAAIKSAFDDLKEQVTKHKDLLRSQHKWPHRRRVGRTRPQPQVPFEETIAAVKAPTVSGDDISSYINANLNRLMRFVERELRYRENSGELAPEQLSPEEVVDEAIANALGDGAERPERLALEAWLYHLALRAMGELAARNNDNVASISLDKPLWKANVRASHESQLQFHQPDEDFTEASIIADPRVSNPEQAAASEEMVTQVETALLGAKREDRDAFLLFAIEGFTPDEIAVISRRPAEQVRASIRSAREFLRKALPVNSRFKDKLLEHSKSA